MPTDKEDVSKQPEPWSTMWPEAADFIDEWGVRHDAKAPDMGEAGPHPAGAKITPQTAADAERYRKRLRKVAAEMEAGREAIRRGQPGDDFEQRVNDLRELAEQDQREAAAEQAEARQEAPQSRQTAQDGRTPVLAPTAPPGPRDEPCDRCHADTSARNRHDGHLYCPTCQAHVWRYGEAPLSPAQALVLLARQARDRLRRSGR